MPVTILVPRYQRRDRLDRAILDLRPTLYLPMRDPVGPLRDASGGRWDATITGSPTYGVAAPSPIGRGVTWSGSGQYATTGTGIPNPSTGISVLAIGKTSDGSATNRHFIARANSFRLYLNGGHTPTMDIIQPGGSTHAGINAGAAANTGEWFMAVGTFDGATVTCRLIFAGGSLSSNSSSSLTGSWGKASVAAATIGSNGAAGYFVGTSAHTAIINDRVLTTADVRWLASVAFGG